MSTTFEQYIMQCCKSEESNLRRFFRRILPKFGFTIQEDDYISERVSKYPNMKTVHNMLAIRGNNPKVCLVSHTDVCRDKLSENVHPWYGDPKKKPEGRHMVQPIIRTVEIETDSGQHESRRIITDKDERFQVGGDDRLGVAINTWIALNTDADMGILLPTDEEIGLKSAEMVNFADLKNFELFVEVDRGNHSDELVNKIGGTQLCDYDTSVRLLEIAYDIGKPRTIVNGAGTDVVAMKRRGIIKNAVNMTCGYHHSVGSSAKEYIDIEEARDTMKYVAAIIRSYNLPKFEEEEEKA